MKIRPLIKIFGGKYYMAKWIIDKFPPNYREMIYVEPFIGGGSVLLQKFPSAREVIADTDLDLVLLWQQCKLNVKELISDLLRIEYSEESFQKAIRGEYSKEISRYVLGRMSRSGMCKTFAQSNRERGGQMGDKNAWQTSLQNLLLINGRIQNVDILWQDFYATMQDNNYPNTLFYLDPTYLHETRKSKKVYKHEMTLQAHKDLLQLCLQCKGKVVLSGYKSDLYMNTLKDWRFFEKSIVNHSGQGKKKQQRVECLWLNY